MRRLGTAVYLSSAPAGSDEWHEARRPRINGSEIAAVMGISPFESPFSLWHRKAGSLSDVATNDVMYWGTRHEPTIRSEWNLRHPEAAVKRTGQWMHHARAWQAGGPDGIGRKRLWEGKTARYAEGWGEEGTDELPVYYRAQTLWYLDVFGWLQCDVSVLIAGSEYREYVVTYDPAEVEPMRLKAEEFLASIAAGQAPAIDGHEATYEAVRELHPDIDPASVEVAADIAEPYLQSLRDEQDAKQEKRRCSALLVEAMGSAKDAYYQGIRIASRQAKKTDGSIPYLVAAKGAADHHEKGIAA